MHCHRNSLHPGGETLAGGISPLFRLAVGGGNRSVASSEFGNDLPDIVGKIDILRETLDDVVAFRERCAAFEDEMLAYLRLKQPLQSPHNPDILLEQISWPG